MNFAETKVPIELGTDSNGKPITRILIFNANTMCAYEEATKKFFLDTVTSLYDAMRPALDAQKTVEAETSSVPATNAFNIIHKVPMKDLRALIWAALHEYDRDDNPVWPLTIGQVGRLIQLQDVPRVFNAFLRGQIKNSPSTEELGESRASSAPAAPNPLGGATLKTGAESGGERSIELPADAFA